MLDLFSRIVFIFIVYSFGGWVMETIKVSIAEKRFVNRGFLFGPYCPIYGFGALTLYLLLDGLTNRPIIYFMAAFFIAAVLEYVTNYVQEKKYHARWWDYSNKPFNVNGRICLENLIYFAGFGTLIMCTFNKYVIELFYLIPEYLRLVICASLLSVIIFDNIISKILIKEIKCDIAEIKGDNTKEINEKLDELLKQKSILKRRLFKAYPGLRLAKLGELVKKTEKNFEERIKELEEKIEELENKDSKDN